MESVDLYFYNDSEAQEGGAAALQRILWPNSHEQELINSQGLSEPITHSQQVFFINDLEVQPDLREKMEQFLNVCQQYNYNTLRHDIRKSEEDWFHALFYNFEQCEMDVDLRNAIQFVLRKYEPLKEIPNSEMQWTFVKRVFSMVAKHKSSTIKIFLLLALVTWEKELADSVSKLCTTPRTKQNFVFCLPHLKSLVDRFTLAPYTRNNITYLIQFFMVQAVKLCQMNVLPDIDHRLEQYQKEQHMIRQQEKGGRDANDEVASANHSLYDLNI
jgi:hypothetical protein